MENISSYLENLPGSDLYVLFQESESLRGSGVVPDDAKLRWVASVVFGQCTVLDLMRVSTEVYREAAIRGYNNSLYVPE